MNLKKHLDLFSNVVGIIFIISSLLLLGNIIYFDFLNTKLFIASILVILVVTILLGLILYHKKTDKNIKFIGTIVALVLSILSIIATFFILKTCDFVNKINKSELTYENYYVLINKNNTSSDVNDFNTIDTYNENIELYRNALSNLEDEYENEFNEVEKVTDLGPILLDDGAIFVSKTHKKILEDEIDNFKDEYKIIYSTRVSSKEKLVEETKREEVKNTKVRNTFTVLISGIDTKGAITNRGRSDVNMLLTVNTTNKEILLTSIPRDYKININDSLDKLTHTGVYGIDTSIDAIEELLNINIDYYVKVNFTTLIKIVDSINGINIYSDKSFRAHTDKDVYINEGNNYLDGKSALAYSRERYAYIGGDRHRVSNQQDVIISIINSINAKTVIADYNNILNNLEDNIETNIAMKDITNLIKYNVDNRSNWNIKKYSLDGFDSYNNTYSIGNCYVMEPNYDTVINANSYINSMVEGKKLKEIMGE